MIIIRAASTGMCFGVRDALKVIDTIDRPDRLTINGQLVHNEAVLLHIGARGFHMTGESDRGRHPETPTVLITAHGVSDIERRRLQSAGTQLIDTTCPLVRRVHLAAQSLHRQGFYILVVGRRHHVEVRGIVEDLAEYEIIESVNDVRSYSAPRLGVICQTTTAPATVAAVRRALVDCNPRADLRFLDTTCAPTRDNQRALDELLPQVDAMVVVGGRNSNNTHELVATCRAAGKPTYHVQDADELKPEWFTGRECIGLAAGTSTLDATLEAVEIRLRQLATPVTDMR